MPILWKCPCISNKPIKNKTIPSMPYEKELDIPVRIRKRLSPSAQKTFLDTSRNAWLVYQVIGDKRMNKQEAVIRAGWTAVKEQYDRMKGGLWTRKKESGA
ncbi:hypothetical protein GF382_01200 [Candidatus Falkowbacteria bacterium]|nr:hypothetical protein [Candidatus Falkowbacteria bacterium]